ncbi:MAG TPA: GNAT family N-acetyltransferase [Gemmatimonadota bacterium]|nr:GNAT family N-acetyltransferase [Gemmatimonadota bacterium]
MTGPGPPSKNAAVSLREVTRETLRSVLSLRVAPDQEGFVAPNPVSIAEAHFYPDNAWFRAIYASETPVGFLMLHDDPAKPAYHLWRFMIDHRFQRMGFGRRALAVLFEHVRTRPGATELTLSHGPGEGNPGPFYARLGFEYTGEVEDGERVMRIGLE